MAESSPFMCSVFQISNSETNNFVCKALEKIINSTQHEQFFSETAFFKKIAGIVALKSVGGVFCGFSGTTVPLFQ